MASRYDAPRPGFVRRHLAGLSTQRRVIGALMLRELHTRYGRDNIGYAWLLGEPLMLASAIAAIHRAVGGHAQPSGIHPAAFAAMGYTMFMLVRQIFTRSEGAIESNAPLLHHRQVTLFDICMSRSLLELISVLLTFAVMVAISMAVGWMSAPARPGYLALSFALLFLFASGVGMILCALVEMSALAGRLVHPFTYLLVPSTGAFFSISWLSESWRDGIFYWPFPHFFEMMRYGAFESATDLYFSVPYAAFCGLVAWVAGLCALNVLDHHIHAP